MVRSPILRITVGHKCRSQTSKNFQFLSLECTGWVRTHKKKVFALETILKINNLFIISFLRSVEPTSQFKFWIRTSSFHQFFIPRQNSVCVRFSFFLFFLQQNFNDVRVVFCFCRSVRFTLKNCTRFYHVGNENNYSKSSDVDDYFVIIKWMYVRASECIYFFMKFFFLSFFFSFVHINFSFRWIENSFFFLFKYFSQEISS